MSELDIFERIGLSLKRIDHWDYVLHIFTITAWHRSYHGYWIVNRLFLLCIFIHCAHSTRQIISVWFIFTQLKFNMLMYASIQQRHQA